jgi:hypothetical protein
MATTGTSGGRMMVLIGSVLIVLGGVALIAASARRPQSAR